MSLLIKCEGCDRYVDHFMISTIQGVNHCPECYHEITMPNPSTLQLGEEMELFEQEKTGVDRYLEVNHRIAQHFNKGMELREEQEKIWNTLSQQEKDRVREIVKEMAKE